MLGDAKIGIIIPPKEIRAMVDKTAEYVAKNGSKFEETIYNNQSSDDFAFLRLDNPYRAYYDKKVVEFSKEMIEIQQLNAHETIRAYDTRDQLEEESLDDIYRFVAKQPELTIGEKDLIIITAQYVALNGEEFLVQLSALERDNPNYVFLRPNHPHFGYFTSLVDMYIEIITNIQNHTKRLMGYTQSYENLLKECDDRIKAEESHKKHLKSMIVDTTKEINYTYEWNNFIIVETIDFDDRTDNAKSNDNKNNPEIALVFSQLKNKDNYKRINETGSKIPTVEVGSMVLVGDDDKTYVKCDLCGRNIESRFFDAHMKEELKLNKKHSIAQNVEKDIDYSGALNRLVDKRNEMLNLDDNQNRNDGKYEVIERPAFLKNQKPN